MAARKDDAGGRTLRSLTRISATDYEGTSQNIGTDYRAFIGRSSNKTPTQVPHGRKVISTALSSVTRFRRNDQALSIRCWRCLHARDHSWCVGQNNGPYCLRHECGQGSGGFGGPLSIGIAETVNTTDYDVLFCGAYQRLSLRIAISQAR
jgi:hypothetical protein